jgi:hypothetical protein
MRKPSAKVAKIAVVALAIPLFGGFATYAAAQVSTKPAPQVVIPGGPGKDDKVAVTKTTVADDRSNRAKGHVTTTTVSDDPAGHDANDDNGHDAVGHDANDDNGGLTQTTVSDDPAGHDANDDNGGVTPTTVSDDPAGHDAIDDNGHDAVTPATPATTPVSTPTTVDDHSGKDGSGGHGSDG